MFVVDPLDHGWNVGGTNHFSKQPFIGRTAVRHNELVQTLRRMINGQLVTCKVLWNRYLWSFCVDLGVGWNDYQLDSNIALHTSNRQINSRRCRLTIYLFKTSLCIINIGTSCSPVLNFGANLIVKTICTTIKENRFVMSSIWVLLDKSYFHTPL